MKLHRILIIIHLIFMITPLRAQPVQAKFYNRTGYTINHLVVLKKPVGTLNKSASVTLKFDSLDICWNIVPCEINHVSGEIKDLKLNEGVQAYAYLPETVKRATQNDKLEFDIVIKRSSFEGTILSFDKHRFQNAKPAASQKNLKKQK